MAAVFLKKINKLQKLEMELKFLNLYVFRSTLSSNKLHLVNPEMTYS